MADVVERTGQPHGRALGTSSSSRKTLVLCFDGTGNKFQGNDGDSNIIKIFSMLDRQSANTYAYYQPGIGTYLEGSALSKTSSIARLKSWYRKAKDQAVGTSFDAHVRGGYSFLMRYYADGDDIYFFGFSRGAYMARFLAQMLDAVGLLSAGNEEMFRFAWKAFSQWQTRLEETEEQRQKKTETYNFMKAFRETFSRPVRRIRFMGLFDTVNSVPRFEGAWMKRTRVPYASRSSAKVVRHAVAIDERRAKFRQNLISQKAPRHNTALHPHLHLHHHQQRSGPGQEKQSSSAGDDGAKPSKGARFKPRRSDNNLAIPNHGLSVTSDAASTSSQVSVNSTSHVAAVNTHAAEFDDDDEDVPQNIEEVWFPGCHADIGGGWPLAEGEHVSLAHTPLLWMIREAWRAGLPFDEEALREAGYILTEPDAEAEEAGQGPIIQVDGRPLESTNNENSEYHKYHRRFHDTLHFSTTKGSMHDSLQFGQGTAGGGVIAWNVMEYLPFRRMDLRDDGTWAPIRWPLPCGEVRDVPREAWVHNSVLKRMDADPTYRPGNLIIGGGGRGSRRAPEHLGKGNWKVLKEHGDAVGEILVRADVEAET